MYNSQYYTCEQIDQRLLQGYLDDYNSQNNTNLTKAEFLTLLFNTAGRNSTVDNLVTQIGYYECDTAGATAAKAITVANYALFAGGSMKVKFINKNTVNNATLNINGKGAKALYYRGELVSSTNTWEDGEVVEIYYDGTSYYANSVKGGYGDGVFNISKYNLTEGQPTQYSSLSEALGTNANNIPIQYRHSSMLITYLNNSDPDNIEYVQFRYKLDYENSSSGNRNFRNVNNWKGVDKEPVQDSDNLVESGGVFNFKDIFLQLSKNNSIDLCFVDRRSNAIVYFKNGHIKTKNFDSSNIAANLTIDTLHDIDDPLDFAISDLVGNKPLIVLNGHIITKEFDSRQAAISYLSEINGFAIQDVRSNSVMVIKKNGRLITKGFDSDNIKLVSTDLDIGLAIQDVNGNTAFLIKDGHILTKEFDSRQAAISKSADLNGFGIQDGLGNKVLIVKKDGRLITKGFDSDNIKLVSTERPVDIALQDSKENIVVLLKDGHIITKNFDSRDVAPILNRAKNNGFFINEWSGKNICFLGDSIIDNNFVCNAIKDTLKCNIYNRGWGGAMITPTKYLQGSDESDYSKKGYHFTNVCDLPESNNPDNHHGGMPSADLIDLVVIHGGGNDYGHGNQTSRTVIGVGSIEEAMGNDLTYLPEGETDPTATVGSTFAAALKYTCYKLRQKYPNIPVAICTIFRSYDYAGQSSHTEYFVNQDMSITPNVRTYRDGVKNKEDFNNIIRAVARQFGMYVIDFDKFGMPSYNEYFGDLYYVHKESTGHGDLTHPSENYGAWNYGKFMSKEIMMIPYMDKSKVSEDSGDYPDNPEGN